MKIEQTERTFIVRMDRVRQMMEREPTFRKRKKDIGLKEGLFGLLIDKEIPVKKIGRG